MSFVASVPLPVAKLAMCGIVPAEEALNKAEAKTEVNAPLAVKVCSINVVFDAAVCVLVVASALESPLVAISPVNVVSPTAGVMVDSVDATQPAPRVPAAVFVYTCACIQSLPALVSKLCLRQAICLRLPVLAFVTTAEQ